MKALLIRDIRLAVRAGGGFGLGLAFFLIVIVMVPFAVGADTGLLSKIAPGVLWIGALLACLLSLDRLLALDFEDGTLDLLATAPLPLEAALSVKALAHGPALGHRSPSIGCADEPSNAGVCLAGVIATVGYARAVRNRHLRCCADRRDKTRWAIVVLAGSTALSANAYFRGRSRTARGRRGRCQHTDAVAGRDKCRNDRVDAIRQRCCP